MQSAPGPNDRQTAVFISVFAALATAAVTILTFWIVYGLALAPDIPSVKAEQQAPYDYNAGIQAIVEAEPNVVPEGDTRDPWLGNAAWTEAIQAGQLYISQYPQPQSIQVLQGMNTAQIWNYMQRVSGALGVSCQYCHEIDNYASYTYQQKTSGLLMLQLVQKLNSEYMVSLPNWRGNYVQCDTCHYGEVQGMPAVSETFLGGTPPIDVNLQPLNAAGEPVTSTMRMSLEEATVYNLYNYQVWKPYNAADRTSGRGSLAMTYEGGRTQDQVTISQNAMNLMGWSLGVGCTYCHDSRNFYAYEADIDAPQFTQAYAINRLKTQRMLLMTTFMAENWNRYVLPRVDLQAGGAAEPASLPLDGQNYYVELDGFTYAVPGCYTCHQGNVVPKGAVNSATLPEGDASVISFPPTLTGLGQN